MSRVAVVTDSTADLPPDLAAASGITVVPLTVIFGDASFRDGVDLESAGFLRLLATSSVPPTTSQPTPESFAEAYRTLARDHDAIVSVHIAATLSGTIRSARIAARMVEDEIPVTVVDSTSASMACGFLALTAAHMAKRGEPAAEIADVARTLADRMDAVFVVESLDALRRGGRIGRASALLGTVLDLKPILRLANGTVIPLARTRTYRRAVRTMVDHVRQQGEIARICAVHAGNPQGAADVLHEFDGTVPPDQMLIAALGPVIAAHTGPGTLGLIFERRTDAP